ncbi:MAG: pilus assembly protein PilM [Lachnospiraceae bacterium]|nr:pilus assembly protein PilM [Lachnospiraceae bacterium]
MAVTKVLSIEVTDVVTRVIEVDYGKKDPVVHKAIVFPTPEKTVSDGVIESVETFAKEFQRQTHGFGTKNAVFVLATNKVISREVSIPEMKDDQIPDFIQNQKSEYFPMDTSGHTMVHRILDRDKDKKQIKIIVYAVPQKLVGNYHSFAQLAGLNIVGVDYNGNAIYQWLSNEGHKSMDMYLQINERSTLFTVLENKKYALQRNINFGAYALSDRLIQSGYYDGEMTDQILTRAEALKRLSEEEFVFPSFAAIKLSEPDSEAAERLHSAKEMVTEGMRQLLGNLSRVLEYYHSKNQNAELNTIFVGGCGAKVRGLKAFLENEFSGVEVVVLDQLPNVKVSSSVSKSGINTSELIACIGAADGSLTFLTASKEAKANKLIFLGAIILVAGLIAAIVLVIFGKGKYNNKLNERDKLQVQIDELVNSGIEDLETRYNAAMDSVAKIVEFHNGTYRANEDWNATLSEVETKAVSSMVVSNLSSDSGSVVFNVSVGSKEEAAKLLLQFQQIPYFNKISITSIRESISDMTGQVAVSFTLACEYTQGYIDKDINGDGKVDENDDKNGDGVVDKLDIYGDSNHDGVTDIRDIVKSENDARALIRNLIENDINNDGVVDDADDINKDGEIDDIDRDLFARIENLNIDAIGDLNNDTIVDIMDAVEYLRIADELAAAEAAAANGGVQ